MPTPLPPGILGERPRTLAGPAPARACITCCVTAVRRVSESSTTSTRHSATVCQCGRKDMTLACATRNGPGWGCTSPQHSNRRGERSHH